MITIRLQQIECEFTAWEEAHSDSEYSEILYVIHLRDIKTPINWNVTNNKAIKAWLWHFPSRSFFYFFAPRSDLRGKLKHIKSLKTLRLINLRRRNHRRPAVAEWGKKATTFFLSNYRFSEMNMISDRRIFGRIVSGCWW